jgi:hypothetical protein
VQEESLNELIDSFHTMRATYERSARTATLLTAAAFGLLYVQDAGAPEVPQNVFVASYANEFGRVKGLQADGLKPVVLVKDGRGMRTESAASALRDYDAYQDTTLPFLLLVEVGLATAAVRKECLHLKGWFACRDVYRRYLALRDRQMQAFREPIDLQD